ncbi:MAG: acyl-CoA dehydrogenase family protein [Actinomycetota bacterium]
MDFTPTPDQELLRDTARKLLDRECPPALVRAHIEDPEVYAPLWAHLREYVALGTGPASDLCLFLDETGRAAAPGPFLATTIYAALTGDDDHVGTVAFADDPANPFVLEADRVERIAVVRESHMTVIDRDKATLHVVETVDQSRRLFALDAPNNASTPLAPDARRALLDRAHASIAAEMVGTSRRIFGMALDYAKERQQFDVPIGSFQAIQHKLAEMSLLLERATAAVHYAAMTIDAHHAERTRACHVAKAAAGEAARRILKDGIQIHGGIGYTWEHDLHLYLRRATGDEYLFGATGWHHDRIADLLFG